MTATASRTELKSRMEARRKEMEARLAELKADASGKQRELVDSLEKDFHSMSDAVQEGWDQLTDKTVAKLNEWLGGKEGHRA